MSASEKLPPQILVIELDEIQRIAICNIIERSLFNVIRLSNINDIETSSINAVLIFAPNIIIVSTSIKEVVPIDTFIQKLRSTAQKSHRIEIPIIIILNQNDNVENYQKFDNGLIEIVQYPYTDSEIILAVKSLLRRSRPILKNRLLRYKDLTMDLSNYKVYRGNKPIRLGPTEFKILQLLLESPKVILSREKIIDYVWGHGHKIDLRTVDVHVNRLRNVIKNNKSEPALIKTVRASGYCLKLPGESDYA
ncbi:transcriptional regulator [Orientia tsutsugamushi]|uniref:Transcriptional regulator n=1 Tax=Orientia tsutsugamushi TaxID=784 RepID=A0A2U3R2X0_ORITS|nr:winged helix-turn-helix domain-containing protein [Orientia tsutsugamushi]KJV86612.1 transcriptional regulatory, C terminal family protein [Orientia tsutsugamushi str. UT76]SPR07560.1 transcriptional regulator [Orientia tsutsugamushi]